LGSCNCKRSAGYRRTVYRRGVWPLQRAKKLVDDSKEAKSGSITTVAFNAWRYEQENIPLIPLIATILQMIEKKHKDGLANLKDALRSVLFSLSAKFTTKNPLIGDLEVAIEPAKAIERYEQLRSQWIDQQIGHCLYYNAFQIFEEIQGEAQQGKAHKIVVFIDDLDRCFPNKAIRLLESIKLVLGQRGFIFVLAVDRRILESYLDQRYKRKFGLDDYRQGQSYLDKIIQLPLWIPPHKGRFSSLVKRMLKKHPIDDQTTYSKSLLEIIGFACNHNPRQLIRFFNDLLVDKKIYEDTYTDKTFSRDAFIVSRGIRHQSEMVYQFLIKNKKICEHLKAASSVESLHNLIEELLKNSDQKAEQLFLQEILFRDSILRLLSSKLGNNWLSEHELRNSVHGFLHEKRESDKWAQKQIESALVQLSSSDDKEIISGLHILYAYPQCTEAVEQLTQLTKHSNENISGLARLVLDRLKAVESQV